LYEDASKVVFVSSGIGNSILPIRFYAPSQVEIVTVR
jgi:predicted MPP superfamily phosphohydrolase